MWSNDLQPPARFRDAVQLRNKAKHVWHVLDNVATNDLFKFAIAERIWKRTEVVNDVCMASRVCIDADRAGKLVLTTADVENSFAYR